MAELLQGMLNVFSAMFVLGTMVSMGFGFDAKEMFAPLRRWPIVWRALLLNFIIVPLILQAILWVIPLQPDHQIGFALIAFAAGAPVLPKLMQAAKGDVPTSVGVMFLLVIGSVIFMPIALPLILPNSNVDGGAIARTMFLTLMAPLLIAMAIRWRYPEIAENWLPETQQISNIGLLGSIITLVMSHWATILGLFGSGAILAIILFILAAFITGVVIAGPNLANERPLFGFSAAQRNISAAMVVAANNFSDRPDTIVVVIVASMLMNMVLIFLAAEIGKRRSSEAVEGSAQE